HLDHHHLWDPNEFAVSCFRIIMYSIQAQHSHHVIQQVLNHLDTHNKSTPRVRAGIVQVLLETVAIAAKGSVGASSKCSGSIMEMIVCQPSLITF
ncbi:membrane anchoring protein efr3a, partial [Xenotaenia resolanae]